MFQDWNRFWTSSKWKTGQRLLQGVGFLKVFLWKWRVISCNFPLPWWGSWGPGWWTMKNIFRMVELRSNLRKIDETYPERPYTGTKDTINTTTWLFWSFCTSFVSDSSRHLVEISGGFGEVCKVHVPKWWGLQQNLDGDLWGFKCLHSICIRLFGDVVRHFIATISSISQHVCCGTQIEKELQIDGTCGKLRDAYQAGYSVSLKPLWFHKLKNRANAWIWIVKMFFATCEVVEPVCQVLKYWDSQHQSSWLYTQRLQVYPHGPLDFGTSKGILRFWFYFVFFVGWVLLKS